MLNIYEMLIKRSRSVEPPASDIPTDYFLYMPFKDDLLDHSDYERSFTTTGTAPTLETVDGMKCATFPANTYMRSTDTTGFTGNGNCTLSMWMKIDAIPSNQWNFFFCIGQSGTSKKCTSIGLESPTKYGGGIWGGNRNTQVTPCDVDYNWHHLCYVFNEDSNRLYLDGVMMWKSTTTDTLNIEGGGWGIGNTSTQYSYPPGVVVHYADLRAYYRTITSEELRALASEHQTIASIPTDFVFYARLDDKSATATESGQTITHYGSIDSYIENDKVKGIDCIRSTNADALNSFKIDDTGFPTGNSTRSISIWGYGTASASAAFKDGWSLCKYGTTEVVNYSWFRFYPSSVDNCNGSYSVTYTRDPNAWHNYIVTFDGAGRLEWYVDGVSIGYVTNASFTTLLDALYIFGDGWRGYWSGCLASLRIYDRVLTATEIALLATEFTPMKDITFNNQTVNFAYSAGAGTFTLATDPTGCTFEISSGTLPEGVALNASTGVLSYDGTEVAQDETYTLTITASKTGFVEKTATITIRMHVEATLPLDYVFYAPLVENDAMTAESGQALTYTGTPAETTLHNIPCLDMRNAFIKAPDTGINMGSEPLTMSIWEYATSTSSWHEMLSLGTNTTGRKIVIAQGNSNGYIAAYFYNSAIVSSISSVGAWHNVIITKSGTYYVLFVDGVQVGTLDKSSVYPTSSGNIGIAGFNAANFSGYLTACRIYNRVLTATEIASLATEFTPHYDITVNDQSFSFYQKSETFGIQYTSPGGTPTFEITSGELPSTISFNTSTGQFSGKGLTDADHTYNLTVKLTAPNSTPATCNITIKTYMTARISISSKTFNFYTDGTASDNFSYTSDEAVTFAIESGYSLPSGITLSGNTFYSDGTTTAGSYSVKVRGTSAHNQTGVTGWMYFNVTANVITVNTTELKFYASKGVTSKQVAYTTSHFSITPVYTLTGTLPSGVTFDSSTGTFTSDGTQSSDETASVSVSVASSTGLSTAGTGTISIQVYTTAPAVPDDYILCVPLKTDTVPEVGTFIDKNSNWTFGTAPDGTSAIGNTSSSSFSYSMRFDVATRVTGTNPITLSAWFYDISGTNNCGLMGLGTKSYDHILSPEYSNSTKVGFPWGENWQGSDFGSGNTLRPSANTWHHIAITFDTNYVRWYTDGVLVGTSADASRLNIGSSYLYLGSRVDDNRPFKGYIRNYLVYDRALTTDEIESIYADGIDPAPAPQPTSYLPRRGTDTTMTSTGILYKTATHYFIENGCLYNITGRTAGSAVKVGTSDKWTSCTEYIETTNTADYDTLAYGICDGTLYKLSLGGVATSMNKTCDLVSGHYVKYKSINNNEWFGLGNCSDGLYRLGTSATKINSKHDWVELSGLLYNYNSSNYDGAYGIDSTGTLYRIAYDGTLTQIATSIDHVTGVYRNGSNMGNWGSQPMTGDHSHTNHVLYISDGSLYYTLNAGAISSGTLIDGTGTWTAVYGIASSTAQGYGIRDGKVCSITTSGYTATAHDALAVGYYGWYVASDGLVYNEQGQRLTATTY